MSRNWDGSPETEHDRRFHDLRESGYDGPMDQDGYAVTSGDDARILRDMAATRGENTDWWTGDDEQGGRSVVGTLIGLAILAAAVLVAIYFLSHHH